MEKTIRYALGALLLVVLFWCGMRMADKETLQNELIRLHVVADSDTQEDQARKLLVRDAVLRELETGLDAGMDVREAESYLIEHLDQIEAAANRALAEAGCSDHATVTFGRQEFPTRHYDSFSLPAGIYESLNVTIGSGEGENWWCVVFPGLCIPSASDEVADTAVDAGFSEDLTGAITGDQRYVFSFFFLDCLGHLENFFHMG